MDLAIGQAALQAFDDCPAIGHGLELRGGAEVTEERARFLAGAQRQYGSEKAALVPGFLGLLAPFRMGRLPEITPSADLEGVALG